MKIYLDGKFVDDAEAKVSVFDHGLLYGDGVFEGIRAYNGRVFKLKEHIDRLFYSAKAILLASGQHDASSLVWRPVTARGSWMAAQTLFWTTRSTDSALGFMC